MDQIVRIFIVLITMSGALHVLLAIIAFMNRQAFEGTRTFLWFSSFTAIYAFGYALSLSSTTLEGMKFWTAVQYAGMPFSAPATLILVLQYIGLDKHLNRKTYFLYYLIPVISLVMVSTNDFHHLFYQNVYLDYLNETAIMQITAGQWYLIHGAYTFGTLAIAFILLLINWFKSKANRTIQMSILITGVLVPIITAFIYLLGLTPTGLDPVPIMMIFTSSLYLYAIISTKFLLVPPIVKDSIIESMGDAVVVLDQTYYVKDFNQSARQLYPHIRIGEHIASVVGLDSHLLPLVKKINTKTVIAELEKGEEHKEYYQVKLSPIRNNNVSPVGITMVYMNITEQKKEQLNLTRLAYTDILTQIYNRAYVLQKAEEMFTSQQDMAIILFDIDYFKKINDTYGHLAGDEALKHIAALCKKSIHNEIVLGRYGGEEFILFLYNDGLNEVLTLANRLRRLIDESPLFFNGILIKLSASFGVAIKEHHRSVEELIEAADYALYGAKNEGRNTVCLHVEEKKYKNVLKISTPII